MDITRSGKIKSMQFSVEEDWKGTPSGTLYIIRESDPTGIGRAMVAYRGDTPVRIRNLQRVANRWTHRMTDLVKDRGIVIQLDEVSEADLSHFLDWIIRHDVFSKHNGRLDVHSNSIV